MTINLRRRILLPACDAWLGRSVPINARAALSQTTRPTSLAASRLFGLITSQSFNLDDDMPANGLTLGPRGQRVVKLPVEAPVFDYTLPAAAQDLHAGTKLDGCDWMALIIDAAGPQALIDASAAAHELAQQNLCLRFAVVLEGETPLEPMTLSCFSFWLVFLNLRKR